MISKECYTAQWLQEVSAAQKLNDKGLIEKVVRAMSLLEALVYGTTPAPLPMSMRKWSKPVRSAKAAPRRLGNRVAVLFSEEKCIKFDL